MNRMKPQTANDAAQQAGAARLQPSHASRTALASVCSFFSNRKPSETLHTRRCSTGAAHHALDACLDAANDCGEALLQLGVGEGIRPNHPAN